MPRTKSKSRERINKQFTYEDVNALIFSVPIPPHWRKGQFVFNYIDEIYGVARHVQFVDHVDCFYNDGQIDSFLRCVVDRYNYLVDCQEKK